MPYMMIKTNLRLSICFIKTNNHNVHIDLPVVAVRGMLKPSGALSHTEALQYLHNNTNTRNRCDSLGTRPADKARGPIKVGSLYYSIVVRL